MLISLRVSFAQATYVGLPSGKMNISYAEQNKSQWCWAASIQMILSCYGVSISQEEVVKRSYGSYEDGKLPNWPGSFQTITANLNNWSIDDRGKFYKVTSSLGVGPPTPSILVEELQNQHPVLLAYMNTPNSGHAVVATGASYTPSYFGPVVQTVIVRDPLPSASNRATMGKVEYPGSYLASVITAYWFIRVEVMDKGTIVSAIDANNKGDFASLIQTVVNDADGNYLSLRNTLDSTDGSCKFYSSKINFSNSLYSQVVECDWDSYARFESVFYDGGNESEAADLYNKLKASLKEAFPDVKYIDSGSRFTLISNGKKIILVSYRKKKSRTNRISLEIARKENYHDVPDIYSDDFTPIIHQVIKAADENFMSLRNPTDYSDEDCKSYQSKINIPNALTSEIWECSSQTYPRFKSVFYNEWDEYAAMSAYSSLRDLLKQALPEVEFNEIISLSSGMVYLSGIYKGKKISLNRSYHKYKSEKENNKVWIGIEKEGNNYK